MYYDPTAHVGADEGCYALLRVHVIALYHIALLSIILQYRDRRLE